MNDVWESLSDDDDSLFGEELEYDMWEGQFDLLSTDNNYTDNIQTDYSERFSSKDAKLLQTCSILISLYYVFPI